MQISMSTDENALPTEVRTAIRRAEGARAWPGDRCLLSRHASQFVMDYGQGQGSVGPALEELAWSNNPSTQQNRKHPMMG